MPHVISTGNHTRLLDGYDLPSDRVRHMVENAEAALARLAQEEG
jgi:hypothetical protein